MTKWVLWSAWRIYFLYIALFLESASKMKIEESVKYTFSSFFDIMVYKKVFNGGNFIKKNRDRLNQ
jgi:hypothetical protein